MEGTNWFFDSPKAHVGEDRRKVDWLMRKGDKRPKGKSQLADNG